MANASVEKLKAFGLRQGEKFVVGIAATILVVALGVLATSPTISLTPDELQKKAESAESALRRKQEPATIASTVEAAGIVDPGFVKMVDNQNANALKPADFHARLDWVTPEPGAGLIRDQPELIAPAELMAFPGRGGALLYTLDEKGERIPDAAKNANGAPGRPAAVAKAEEPKAASKRNRALAGKVDEPAKAEVAAKEAEPPAAPEGPFKEETVGKRWVVITGVVDNDLMNKNWLAALKNPSIAYPQYVKVDVERQTRQPDNTWTEWAALNEDAKYAILDNMPEADEELVPEPARPEALVDPLPFLRAGYWTGVHVARLVPAELRNAPQPDENPNVMRGAGRRGGKGMAMMGQANEGMNGEGAGMNKPPGMAGRGSSKMAGMAMGMGGEGGAGMGGGGGPEEAVTPNTEPTLMIRYLDFTVEPNTTYRYRARLVAKNPNFEHSDVNPGTNTTDKLLTGPWSDPSGMVAVPSDVSIYAQTAGMDTRRDDVVNFLVYRWDPAKGGTVVKTDDAAPGFLVGEYGPVLYPSAEGTGAETKSIDFNSRSFVLDALGGKSKIPDIGEERVLFDVPSMAMIVEPDGAVVVRNQVSDRLNEVRKDMDANYHQAIDDSGKKREPARGGGRMMGGAGGQ